MNGPQQISCLFFRQRSGNDFLFFSLIFDRETWVCGLLFFFFDNLVLAFF